MRRLATLAACAAFAIATPAEATNVLANPGFETGSLGPWYQGKSFSSGTDWFVTSADAHTGTYSAEDVGNKELRQDFAGVLTTSIDQVSFWARHPVAGTGSQLAYVFYYSDATSGEFIIDLLGTDWNFFDVTAQLDPLKTLTGFSIYGNSAGDPPITRADDFVINVAGGAVPEPGTWATLMLGFAAAGFALRRSRRQLAKAA